MNVRYFSKYGISGLFTIGDAIKGHLPLICTIIARVSIVCNRMCNISHLTRCYKCDVRSMCIHQMLANSTSALKYAELIVLIVGMNFNCFVKQSLITYNYSDAPISDLADYPIL